MLDDGDVVSSVLLLVLDISGVAGPMARIFFGGLLGSSAIISLSLKLTVVPVR